MPHCTDLMSVTRVQTPGSTWLPEAQVSIPGYFCGLVLLIFVFSGVYNRYVHPLRHFPGPFWASVTDLYKLYLLYCCDITSLTLAQHERYGRTLSAIL